MNKLIGVAVAAGCLAMAVPASALTVEEFFDLPNVSLGATPGEVLYVDLFDELSAFDTFTNLDLTILATVGGVLIPPLNSAGFGSVALTVFLGLDTITGSPEDLLLRDDFIAILFQTTGQTAELAGDRVALVMRFSPGTFTVATFADDFADPRFADFELFTDVGEVAIPLPAPVALLALGLAAIGVAGRRRA